MEKTKELKPGKYLKRRLIDEYAKRLKGSSMLLVTEFGALTNKDLAELRKRLKACATRYLIIKNSLAKFAFKDLKIEGVADSITGSCAVGYGSGDPVAVSKVFVDFIKNNTNLRLKCGYMEGKAININVIRELAALPSREVLLTRLVGCLNSPVSGLVRTCSGVINKFVYALNEISKKKT